jgi:hypothetical protein
MILDIDDHLVAWQVSGQRTVITIGLSVASPAPFAGSDIGHILPGPVLGDRLFQIFQRELQLIVAQLLGAAAEPMAEQALDQHSEFVVLSVQLAMLVCRRGHHIPQHLLQEYGVVRQSVEVDLHGGMMVDAVASTPAFPR